MPDAVSELVGSVRAQLAEAGDPERAPQMQAYMKSAMPYLGVSLPTVRRVLRPVFAAHELADRDEWESAIRELWDEADYREERYGALELAAHRGYRRFADPATLPLYRHLVVSGAWWDLVDPVATRRIGEILSAYRDEVTPAVRAWAVDDDFWLRRTAILAQLHHGPSTDLTLLRAAIEANLDDTRFGREFFVRKAIGWALRQHARTDPDWVRDLVDEFEDRLSGLSRREALKHLSL